jgi:hypothetical protein
MKYIVKLKEIITDICIDDDVMMMMIIIIIKYIIWKVLQYDET